MIMIPEIWFLSNGVIGMKFLAINKREICHLFLNNSPIVVFLMARSITVIWVKNISYVI